jgi:hypothetical protein
MKLFFLIVVCLTAVDRLCSQTEPNGMFDLVPEWRQGQVFNYDFAYSIADQEKGKKTLKKETFKVRMIVEDSSAKGYRLRWQESGRKYWHRHKPIERYIAEFKEENPIVYNCSREGKLLQIFNWEALRASAFSFQKGVKPDSVAQFFTEYVRRYLTPEEMSSSWVLAIKMYHYLLGNEFFKKINSPVKTQKLYPNPYSRGWLTGSQEVTISVYDEESDLLQISIVSALSHQSSRLEFNKLVKENPEFVKNILGMSSLSDIPKYGITEELNCLIRISDGVILEGDYKRFTENREATTTEQIEFTLVN